MKFLLVLTMLAGSAFAHADIDQPNWKIKCYERENQELELSWVIGVNQVKTLFECDGTWSSCQEVGHLNRIERQGENCLVLKRPTPGNSTEMTTDRPQWELCLSEQETMDSSFVSTTERPRRKLVPVTVRASQQEASAYCEKSIRRILR